MADLDKLDAVEGFVSKWVNWAKQNTMIAGFIIAGIPTIATGGYQFITKFNEIKSMYEDFDSVASNASASKRKVEALEERVIEMRETMIKLQERTAETSMAAREAKIVSESNQKEMRAGLAAQKVELEVTANSLKQEMGAIKRATTNRLGN